MKVLHVIDTLNIGGAEKICINIISMLLDSGHQADCMVISSKGQLFEQIDHRSKSFFLSRRNKFNISSMRKCTAIASGYDIVHVHMRHTWAFIKIASLLFNRSIKLVFHDHYGDISIDQNPTFRLKGFFKPKFYIGTSKELAIWATAKLKTDAHKTYILRNTIIPLYIQSCAISGDWIMVSNLRETKNILFAISLAEKMQRKLVIFGNHDGSAYANQVLTKAKESKFFCIIQHEPNIQQYLGNFSMAIHTSLSETGPLVLLEYMANGLPFVTSNTGEVVDQIRDELPDLIVSTFNEEDWIEKIIALENEIQINGQFINRKLKELFNKKFSPEKYIEQCLKIYQNVLTS